jgi:indolepyruvate ferredoxin oxidoreductase
MAMGDDHTGESSTVLHQSDFAMIDANMPVLSPAGVQEIIDYGLYGWALSRFSGLWVGLKVMKDTVEVTSVVDGDIERMTFTEPTFKMPEGGLNIRLVDQPLDQEERLIEYKINAAKDFAKKNKIDKCIWSGGKGPKIGFVAAGKNWLDLVHSLSLLGIDEDEAARFGITTYKVGQIWPFDTASFGTWAKNLDLIVIVEEKRKILEGQIKEFIFDMRSKTRVYGSKKNRLELFTSKFALDPVEIAHKIGDILIEEDCGSEKISSNLSLIAESRKAENTNEIASRIPYFCSGCPHNTSTKIPEGSRAYAGIGCHYMAQWMERETLGYTHMGGEGANWIGEAPFSSRNHVFQNIGDGTYNHSGIQAIRAAVAANVNVTYKILFNDAVAMTGGQGNDGGLDASRIVNELSAFGIKKIVVVYDEKEDITSSDFANNIELYERSQLDYVQRNLREITGVTAIVYVQTCAAEKRRRRKRGKFPDPDKRVFINTDVCEGCGDCGVQSNCVSIVPVKTELGRKRAIDQSSCNKDFSCVKGFCPSFVTVSGAKLKSQGMDEMSLPNLPLPNIPMISGTHNIIITGVGGTGVVTIGAVLAMAAHLDNKGAGMMEMAGLAQKGGAVQIHCRLANKPSDISAIRVATGEADVVMGGDLVVTAGLKTLSLMKEGKTRAVVNNHDIITGEFTRDTDFAVPNDRLVLSLEARLKKMVNFFDSTSLSKSMLGDTIFSNMIIFGAAWQSGMIPLSLEAIVKAIELNGTAVKLNLRAFEVGRWTIVYPENIEKRLKAVVIKFPTNLNEKILFRARHLKEYQSKFLADRYTKFVEKFNGTALVEHVAEGYHKLLAYKDEYEVARLHKSTAKKLRKEFDGKIKITYHLSPPLISRIGHDGRPEKKEFGSFIESLFSILSKLKFLRGSIFDPFGYSDERKMERSLIELYEQDMEILLKDNLLNTEAAVALAKLPMQISGYGLVKKSNYKSAMLRRKELLQLIDENRSVVFSTKNKQNAQKDTK